MKKDKLKEMNEVFRQTLSKAHEPSDFQRLLAVQQGCSPHTGRLPPPLALAVISSRDCVLARLADAGQRPWLDATRPASVAPLPGPGFSVSTALPRREREP